MGCKSEFIYIQNNSGCLIVIEKENQRFEIGTVVKPVTMINPLGFWADQWARTGCVAAIEVNGLHLKVTQREKVPYISGGIRNVLICIFASLLSNKIINDKKKPSRLEASKIFFDKEETQNKQDGMSHRSTIFNQLLRMLGGRSDQVTSED